MKALLALMALTLFLAGCGEEATAPDETPEPTPRAEAKPKAKSKPQRAKVDWENYSPAVKSRIDRLTSRKNCAKLQSEFDIADGNDDAQRSRTGDGNADLMAYIDEGLRRAGCYG